MELAVLGSNDAAHYARALERFRQRHRHLKGTFLVQDGGGSHIAGTTQEHPRDRGAGGVCG
jgi:hypothetical protein